MKTQEATCKSSALYFPRSKYLRSCWLLLGGVSLNPMPEAVSHNESLRKSTSKNKNFAIFFPSQQSVRSSNEKDTTTPWKGSQTTTLSFSTTDIHSLVLILSKARIIIILWLLAVIFTSAEVYIATHPKHISFVDGASSENEDERLN